MTDPELTRREASAAFNAAAAKEKAEAAKGKEEAEGAKRVHRPSLAPGGGSVGAPTKTPYQRAAEKLGAQRPPAGRSDRGDDVEHDM